MRVHSILSMTRTTVLSLGAALALGIGCSGEKADPKTAGKADLNPPGALETVTKDGEIELRWTAGNVEDDFKGYYVFALKKSDYDKNATGMAKFPTNANPLLAGIPRCADNSKWFEAFGLPATDAKCEADKATSASGTAKLTDNGDGTSSANAEAAAEKLKGFVKCKESSAAEPSLVVQAPAVTTQICTVNKLTDGTALANGTTYVFFVVAVAEDDLSVVSWTSNLVSDTPSKGAVVSGTVTIKNDQSSALTIDLTSGSVTLESPPSACVTGACDALSVLNTATVTVPTIHISRAKSTALSFRQRLYISAPESGNVTLQPRGPQTFDPLPAPTGKKANRIPGDQAVPYSASTYPAAGTKFIIYNNQVFDFAVTEGTKTHYGKVVIGDVTYTNDDQDADATVNLSVILQTAPNVTDYLTSPE